jgi:two-component system NtrC family sensor kinase
MRSISRTLLKPIMIVAGIGAAALMVALLILVLTSHRALVLVEPARAHVHHLSELHLAAEQAQTLLERHLSKAPPVTAAEVETVREKLQTLTDDDHNLAPNTPDRLVNASRLLANFANDPQAALVASVSEIRLILAEETRAQTDLIDEMHAYARRENSLALAALLGLPLLAGLAFFILRGGVLNALSRVSELLERLNARQFTPATITDRDGDLKPVLESYNHLVERLAAAEAENAERRSELEKQVRAATRTVLNQRRELAEADRLAAVGETSARIAHELRNPLAGIELALRNLEADYENEAHLSDQPLAERLGPLIGELQRMSRLLTSLLEQGRREPEQPVAIDVGTCLRETAELARYQIPDDVALVTEINGGPINCRLPRDTLRQVVFNLLLNAAEAIGARNGTISLGAKLAGGEMNFEICDDGPGFPQEILELGPRMFVTRRPGGTGLGLATVRRLTEEMGGRMELANRPSGGAIVRLTLPCRSEDA